MLCCCRTLPLIRSSARDRFRGDRPRPIPLLNHTISRSLSRLRCTRTRYDFRSGSPSPPNTLLALCRFCVGHCATLCASRLCPEPPKSSQIGPLWPDPASSTLCRSEGWGFESPTPRHSELQESAPETLSGAFLLVTTACPAGHSLPTAGQYTCMGVKNKASCRQGQDLDKVAARRCPPRRKSAGRSAQE
jgi:hypothetical protein